MLTPKLVLNGELAVVMSFLTHLRTLVSTIRTPTTSTQYGLLSRLVLPEDDYVVAVYVSVHTDVGVDHNVQLQLQPEHTETGNCLIKLTFDCDTQDEKSEEFEVEASLEELGTEIGLYLAIYTAQFFGHGDTRLLATIPEVIKERVDGLGRSIPI